MKTFAMRKTRGTLKNPLSLAERTIVTSKASLTMPTVKSDHIEDILMNNKRFKMFILYPKMCLQCSKQDLRT